MKSNDDTSLKTHVYRLSMCFFPIFATNYRVSEPLFFYHWLPLTHFISSPCHHLIVTDGAKL